MADLTKTDIKMLRSIRNMVTRTHWTKGSYQGQDNGKDLYCLVGLVNFKTGVNPCTNSSRNLSLPPSRNRLIAALEESIKTYGKRKTKPNIESFNDSKKTKREDVLAVLDLAIGDDK